MSHRLNVDYSLKTKYEDGLKEVEIHFQPWQGNSVCITKIIRVDCDELCEDMNNPFRVRHFCLSYFNEEQQQKIRQLISKSWNTYTGFLKTHCLDEKCHLHER